ncbi:flagellar assembly protein FliH [Rhodosalinus sediminis]|uniref:Flagellar assembly protein FliH n=1 Tax=Rhodosalinus sediminis TaxID=1940533 RepID=A0A3D9BXZ7_9RHOB|nr:FliH/SctL family protein [Rhodosalinus sediminis]REC58358.1 flagellar assembly protein FliH [Rhodosalinus sediminis]
MTASDTPRALSHDEIIERLRHRRAAGFDAEGAGAAPTGARAAAFVPQDAPPPPEPEAAPDPGHAPPPPETSEAPAGPEPAITAADLERARDEGRAEGREEARAEAFAEGRAAGHAEGRAEAEAELAELRAVLTTALERLERPEPAVLQGLREEMVDAVLRIASARAGSRIEEMPNAFLARIDALAAQMSDAAGRLTLRLNPEDHAAVLACLEDAPEAARARFEPDPALARGDVALEAPGVALDDRLDLAREP